MSCRSFGEQGLLPEHEGRPELIVLVFLLGEAVALVLADEIPDVRAAVADGLHDLVGFRLRYARVVGALDDEERRLDVRDAAQRRDFEQLGALLRITLVAIFD